MLIESKGLNKNVTGRRNPPVVVLVVILVPSVWSTILVPSGLETARILSIRVNITCNIQNVQKCTKTRITPVGDLGKPALDFLPCLFVIF